LTSEKLCRDLPENVTF